MIDFGRVNKNRAALVAAAAALVGLGATVGAGAVQATRPPIEMAPTVRTPIAKLPASSGVITVKGRVTEVYGDRFVVQDQSGRAMIAAGHQARGAVSVGQMVMVQGRFDDGQLRASYLVDQNGRIVAVGPVGPRPGGAAGPGGPGNDGPPLPPLGCASVPEGPKGPGAPPPGPVNGAALAADGITPPAPPSGTTQAQPTGLSPSSEPANPRR